MTGSIYPLSDICQINPRLDNDALKNEDLVTFIPMAAVDENTGKITRREDRSLKDVLKGFTPFREGDVLFAKITPCMENGKSAIADNLRNKVGFGSTEFHVFRPRKNLRNKWVHFFVRQGSFLHAAENSMTGSAGQKRVPKDFFSRAKIFVPPLEVQDQTIKLLEEIELLLQKRREAIRLLDDFLKSTFLEMFGDPNNNSKPWPIRRLGDIAKLDMGGTPSTQRRDFYENGTVCWMKSGDIKGDYIFDVPNKITGLGVKYSNTKKYPKGAVVIALNGQGKTRGTTAILALETASNQSVAAITNFEEYLTAEFLHFQLKLRYKQLRNITGDNDRSGLNLTILRDLKIVLPPKANQERFGKIVFNALELSKKMKSSEVELQNLFNCLMQKAFKGELFNA